MKELFSDKKYLRSFLIFGLIASLILCGFRAAAEFKNTDVCVVMTADDMAVIDGALTGVREFDGTPILDGIQLLVEDEAQYSYANDYTPSSRYDNPPLARCFYLYPQFAARYNYLGYAGAEEIENILYRAVTDRNIRVLWLTPFVDAETGETVTDAAVYNDVLENLSGRLQRQGLTLGNSFSVLVESDNFNAIMLPMILGIVGAAVLLLGRFIPLDDRKRMIITTTGFALCLAVMIVDICIHTRLLEQLLAFAAAVIFPCIALWYMTTRLATVQNQGLARELGAYVRILFAAVGICIIGGLFVGAVQSSSDYLLAIKNFRGVKLSQLLPIIFAVYVVLRYLCPPKEILRGRKFILILGGLALLAGVGYYILRTGNATVGVLEQRFRNWLEYVLIVRPRTKEFMVAWPCLAIAFALVARGKKHYAWPFSILTSAGFASVVNTFCHSRAPLWLSLTRTLLGAVIGCTIGLVIICIVHKRPETD